MDSAPISFTLFLFLLAVIAPTVNSNYDTSMVHRLLEDRDREECAQAMGVTVGNFDVILHRATKAFRKVYPP